MNSRHRLQRYKTFIFDVGGTLLRLNLDGLAAAYLDAGKRFQVSIAFERARAVLGRLERELPQRTQGRDISLENGCGADFWEEFYSDGFRQLGVTGDVSAAARKIRARFQRGEFETLHADALPALAALRARGVRMGVVSNFSPNCEDILRAQGVHAYFDFFIVSAVVGIEKPDPRIFDLAVSAARRGRAEMVYIGDSVHHDIQGAQGAGLAAILIDRENRHRGLDGARVRDLRELESFVEGEYAHAT